MQSTNNPNRRHSGAFFRIAPKEWSRRDDDRDALSSEAIRKRIDAGPIPFGLTLGVATQTVRFGLSKPHTASFDDRPLDVNRRQWVKA
jgi:hypothetical protein